MNTAIVLNSTPKYYWLLVASVLLIKRYGKSCPWSIYIGTEYPDHPAIQFLREIENVRIITLAKKDAHFLESRVATLQALAPEIHFVLPLQEDFLLERPGPDMEALEEAMQILQTDSTIVCTRLMPCPGPSGNAEPYAKQWKFLNQKDIPFCYQATLWRRSDYLNFLQTLISQIKQQIPEFSVIDENNAKEYNRFCVSGNPAETEFGTKLFQTLFEGRRLIGWPRIGPWSNAVYQSPWPYRPTAVVKGVLQPFAKELLEREGIWSLCEKYR